MRFSQKLRVIVATLAIGLGSWSCSSSGGDEEFQEEIQEQEFDNQEAAGDQDFDQQQEFAEDFGEGNSQQLANEQSENFTQEQLANLSEEELAELEAEVQSLQNMASNDAGQGDLQAILNDVNQEGNEFAQQNQDNLFANQNQDFGLDDTNEVAANSFGEDAGFASDEGYVDLGSDDSSQEFVDLDGNENVVESVVGAGSDDEYVSLEDDSDKSYVSIASTKSKRKKRAYRPSWRYSYESAQSVSVALPEMGTKMPYIIERGDTLSVVAKRIYGNMSRWQELANSNGISDVNRIYPGDLVYYTLDSSSQSFAQAYEGRGKSVYTAQAGETLRSIASKIYGTAQAWKILWRYNDSLGNPDTLQPGQSVYYAAPQRLSASVTSEKAKEEVVYNLPKQEELTAMQRIAAFFTQG